MGYNLGIDIGIASIGFAGVTPDNQKILCRGVHIFEAAENPKTGASLAEPRRTKRGMRRVIHRRAVRKNDIRRLLAKHGLKDIQSIDSKNPKGKPVPLSVWDLRRLALERKLTDAEFARVLFHIAKRRGFQSNRKGAEPNDTEGQAVKTGIKDLEMRAMGHKTIAAYLSTREKKRNGSGSYENSIDRESLRQEVKKIFEAQRNFGNDKATPQLESEYAGSGKKEERNTREGDGFAFYQLPLKSSEHLVGTCFFTGEKRAPKFSYTAELFILWTKLNNCKIRDIKGNERFLTQDEKNRLADKAHSLKSFSYKQARKELDLTENERFNIGYRQIDKNDNSWEKIRETTEKKDFLILPGYHALKEALGTGSAADWQKWIGPDRGKLDDIARVLSFHEDKKEVDGQLSVHGLSDEQKTALCKITIFRKTIDLSLKALREGKDGKLGILEHMMQGMIYDKACEASGYDHSRTENKGLSEIPPFEDVRNPVVNRALAQARKVINAIIRTHGMPDTIIVELARDVGMRFQDRKDIEREQKKNEAYREEAKKHVAEILGMIPENVRGEDILKYRLLQEQQHFCPYCGSKITPDQFKDGTSTQIDHIIPYSRSWDDSYMNKILCHTGCNQEKGNQTPFEWLGSTKRWDGVVSESSKLPPKKAERLLTEEFDDSKEDKWKDRALNDTRYMARLLKNHLEQTLDLGKGNRVQTRNGALTANLRRAWGFPDKDRRNDRHHAIDAIVLACSTQSMVQRLSNWNRYEARRKNPAERPLPPAPWENFRADAMAAVYGPKNEDGKRAGGIFVSRMPVRKITGAAHEDTIRSIRMTKEGDRQIIQTVKLKDLTSQKLEDMVDKPRNFKLYNVLKERLDAHGGDAKKAFAEPVHMPTNDPSKQGPRINSIRMLTSEKSGIEINNGLASNGDMVRVDVFTKPSKKGKNEFYLCPIYVHHFAQKELPKKVIKIKKDESEWDEINDNYEFLFSLYKNDLIRIVTKDKEELLGYYRDTHRSNASITIRSHDSDGTFGKDGEREGLGVKGLLVFEKYTVDYFGRTQKIEKETRLGVADLDDPESGEDVPVQGAVAAAE
jgi:CRISPR-associated endonuclease Csn1